MEKSKCPQVEIMELKEAYYGLTLENLRLSRTVGWLYKVIEHNVEGREDGSKDEA
jgi:hypothetical protein